MPRNLNIKVRGWANKIFLVFSFSLWFSQRVYIVEDEGLGGRVQGLYFLGAHHRPRGKARDGDGVGLMFVFGTVRMSIRDWI